MVAGDFIEVYSSPDNQGKAATTENIICLLT
jgi:hypothetical protein